MSVIPEGKRVALYAGDCLQSLKKLPDNSIDSVVTDPPYGLSEHRTTDVIDCLRAWINGEPYLTKKKGFMNANWDSWTPGPEVWRECLRVLKPGGHMLVFAGTRSMDLMSMAVRLSGFELRDSIGYAHDGGGAPLLAWTYGTGFPKSMDVSKAIDRDAGAEREVVGRAVYGDGHVQNRAESMGYGGCDPFADDRRITAPATEAARQWQGWGTALKPAWEPIIIARKPLDGTVAQNVQKWGVGGVNVDGCRIEAERATGWGGGGSNLHEGGLSREGGDARPTQGRWPANLIHDGSEEVLALFPQSKGQQGALTGDEPSSKTSNVFGEFTGRTPIQPRNDTGSAARFFYSAKASKADRDEGLEKKRTGGMQATSDGSMLTGSGNERTTARANTHPTVKPTKLMQWLCRLITPPDGIVLDPFMGSGSTGKAAMLEGFRFVGMEMSPDHMEIAKARIRHAMNKHANDNTEQECKAAKQA